jgi:hypothetical protein
MSGLLKAGLHPRASHSFTAAGIPAWRLGQTVGHAKASSGTHEADGTVGGEAYCAATDLNISDIKRTELPPVMKPMLEAQVRDFLTGRNGLASHAPYHFWQPDLTTRGIVGAYFNARHVVHEEDELVKSSINVDGVKSPAWFDPEEGQNYVPLTPAVKGALMRAGFAIDWNPKAKVITLSSKKQPG